MSPYAAKASARIFSTCVSLRALESHSAEEITESVREDLKEGEERTRKAKSSEFWEGKTRAVEGMYLQQGW